MSASIAFLSRIERSFFYVTSKNSTRAKLQSYWAFRTTPLRLDCIGRDKRCGNCWNPILRKVEMKFEDYDIFRHLGLPTASEITADVVADRQTNVFLSDRHRM